MKSAQEIQDFVWSRLIKLSEEYQQQDVGSPAELSSIMIMYATFMALESAPASKVAYDMISESIEAGRQQYEKILKEENTHE